jgi:hypothetical protein
VGARGGSTWWEHVVGARGGSTWWEHVVGARGGRWCQHVVLCLHMGLPSAWPTHILTLPTYSHYQHTGHPIVDDTKYGGRDCTLGAWTTSSAVEAMAARSVAELLPAAPSFPPESHDTLCEEWLGLANPNPNPNPNPKG